MQIKKKKKHRKKNTESPAKSCAYVFNWGGGCSRPSCPLSEIPPGPATATGDGFWDNVRPRSGAVDVFISSNQIKSNQIKPKRIESSRKRPTRRKPETGTLSTPATPLKCKVPGPFTPTHGSCALPLSSSLQPSLYHPFPHHLAVSCCSSSSMLSIARKTFKRVPSFQDLLQGRMTHPDM